MITREVADRVGSSHVAGKYGFGDRDYLNEGADRLLEMGSRVIKLWFTSHLQRDYPFNSNWPKINSLIELAQTQYYSSVFDKPFTTFILETFPPGDEDHDFRRGLGEDDIRWHSEKLYELTKYLANTYKGTGKTFILQNWESDWLLTDPKFTREPEDTVIQGMIDWLNARQDGVDRARDEVGMDGVMVAHAAEVNLVARAMDGKVTATNDVIPHTHCDLYSYSAYDTMIFEPDRFTEALDYLCDKSPSSKLFGDKNVFVGEFGAPENEFDQLQRTQRTVEEALDWGALYVIYWQLYCNEPKQEHHYTGRPTNSDLRGFWLIRPDGTKSPAWHYFHKLFKG